MQLGILGYVTQTERDVSDRLRDATATLQRARRRATDDDVRYFLDVTARAVRRARRRLIGGEALGELTYALREEVQAAAQKIIRADLDQIAADLADLGLHDVGIASAQSSMLATTFATDEYSPLNALDAVKLALDAVDVNRAGEALAILPMETTTVTEDMATSMRLHALGWKSVF